MGNTFQRECGCGLGGPWDRRPEGVYFRADEGEPTRSCLPQVDPNHAERRRAIADAVHSYRLRWCGARGADQWPVGLPDPLPTCEQHAGYLSEMLSWQRRAVGVISECFGDATAAMFERSEHWRE
eukprot:Hpha_TRINITY_DN33058_c0_g1::TRINITY_DN33058_c0_g1_i1::g.158676::m.158676